MRHGAIAQLGERLPCTQEVSSSILLSSTNSLLIFEIRSKRFAKCFALVFNNQKFFNKIEMKKLIV